MPYLLDLLVILIFLLSVWLGHKRGLIKTVTGIVAFLVAMVLSSMLSAPLANVLYDKAVAPTIESAVEEQLQQMQNNAAQELGNVYDALPSTVQNLLAYAGIEDAEAFAERVPAGETTALTQRVSEAVRPVVMPLLQGLCSLVLFLILYILTRLAMKLLNVVVKLPLLKQVNKTFGFIGGAVSGLLWVLFAVRVMQALASFAVAGDLLTAATLEQTTIVSWLAGINPMG
jgi:uncharacterized membrane protein required for colicin V production